MNFLISNFKHPIIFYVHATLQGQTHTHFNMKCMDIKFFYYEIIKYIFRSICTITKL